MKIVEVNPQEKNNYNRFVMTNETGSFLQSWEWGEWQAALGRPVSRFRISDDSGAQVGSIQLIKMPLPFKKFYLYAPYGPVIGSGKWEAGSWMDELKKKFADAIFIRMEPKSPFPISNIPAFAEASAGRQYPISKSPNIQPGKTLIINLNKSEEQLLAEMHHKTRYNIKLAQKHGVEIKDGFNISVGHGLFFEETLKLILETSKRQKFTTFSAEYYQKMVDFFTLNNQSGIRMHIYKAIFQNQLLGAAIMLDF